MEDWEAVRGVVLDGAIYCTRAVIELDGREPLRAHPVLHRRRRLRRRQRDAPTSRRRRWAWSGWRAALASEFAPHNIRVNVVSPGSIDTRRDNPEWYQGRVPNAAGIPLGRQGTVDEIAATCLFLVSDDGGFITGQTIHVNGGVAYY